MAIFGALECSLCGNGNVVNCGYSEQAVSALPVVQMRNKSLFVIACQAMSGRSVLKKMFEFLFLPENISPSGDNQSCFLPEESETRIKSVKSFTINSFF